MYLVELQAQMLYLLFSKLEFSLCLLMPFLFASESLCEYFAPAFLLLLLRKTLPCVKCMRDVLVVFLFHFAQIFSVKMVL